MSELLDVRGAAAYLGVNEAFIRRLVLEKRVQYYKVGKFVRFRPCDLDAMVERGRVEPAAGLPARPTRARARARGGRQAS